jgi:hypothetical protein
MLSVAASVIMLGNSAFAYPIQQEWNVVGVYDIGYILAGIYYYPVPLDIISSDPAAGTFSATTNRGYAVENGSWDDSSISFQFVEGSETATFVGTIAADGTFSGNVQDGSFGGPWFTLDGQASSVPEPSSALIMVCAVLGVGLLRRTAGLARIDQTRRWPWRGHRFYPVRQGRLGEPTFCWRAGPRYWSSLEMAKGRVASDYCDTTTIFGFGLLKGAL